MARTKTVQLRVTAQELRQWKRYATLANMKLSEWVRAAVMLKTDATVHR
jgi:hypothetical protein